MRIVFRGGAEITGLVLSVISSLWVSRAIGPSYFGYYVVMVTIITLGGLVINAGLPNVGSQRIANDPSGTGEILWAVTVSRAALAAVAILGGLVVLAVAPVDPVLRGYLRVGFVVWAFIPLSDGWVLVAQGQLRVISVLRVAGSIATLLAAVLLVGDISDADRVAWVPVVGAIVTGIGSSFVAQRQSAFRRPVDTNLSTTIPAFLKDGIHYLKADVSSFIFTSSDRLFLYAFATPAAVGLYGAAYNVIQPFYMITAVVWDAMYLPLAQAFGTDRLRPTFRRYVDLMCFATIPLGFFLLAFASYVITILYGTTYAAASDYLAVLGWVITFGFMAGVAAMPFSAWNRPREYGNSLFLGGALNLGLNLVLIPPYEGFGAAWATVAAKIAVMLSALRYFRRATDYPIIRDFVEYASFSTVAFAAAFAASHLLPYPDASGIVIFGLVYVTMVAAVRWRRYGPVTAATNLAALVSEHPDVGKSSPS